MENNENIALGMIETGCFTAIVEAPDAMVKTAPIKIIDVGKKHTNPVDYHDFTLKAAKTSYQQKL